MSIFTKLKTATDFSASVIKEGFALIWPEKKSDGSVALQVKLEDGSVQEIGGGSAGDIDESRLLPNVSGLTQADDGKVMQFKFTSAEAGVPFCCNCQTLASGGNNQLVNESGGATITMNGVALSQDVEGPFGGASVGGFSFSSMSDAGSVVIQPAPAVDADSDLTLEYWLYPNKDTLNYCTILMAKTASGGSLDRLNFSDGALEFANKGIIPASAISSLAVTLGKWHHIAISRKNQITRLFIDGVKVGEGFTAWSILAEEEIKWCFYAAANTNSGNCRCGGFRYSRSALYENDFEVPTAPFSVNAGRKMVLDFMQEATSSKAGAMSAADKAKLDALQQAATYINTATDFDTYKTAGSYFLKGAAHTNGPLTDKYAGTLVVVAPAELQYVTQYFTQLYTNKTFVRTYAQDNAKWNAWRRVIVDTDLATTTVAGLMAAADKAAIAGLTARGIYPNALAKSGAIDFNEVIDHGFYFIGGDTPHLNYPETYQQTGGTLQVIRNGNYLTQTLILFDKNKSFNRSCFNAISGSSERKFSAWQRLLTDADITESKARPGYFKLPGGTIVQWGAVLNITADGTTSATLPIAFPNSAFVATATATGSGLIASVAFDGNSKLNVIVKGYPGSGNFTIYWIAIGY